MNNITRSQDISFYNKLKLCRLLWNQSTIIYCQSFDWITILEFIIRNLTNNTIDEVFCTVFFLLVHYLTHICRKSCLYIFTGPHTGQGQDNNVIRRSLLRTVNEDSYYILILVIWWALLAMYWKDACANLTL